MDKIKVNILKGETLNKRQHLGPGRSTAFVPQQAALRLVRNLQFVNCICDYNS